jgi:hypothetical protein
MSQLVTRTLRGIPVLQSAIDDWESVHGGKIVLDDVMIGRWKLNDLLERLMYKHKREHGKFPEYLAPPEFPLERFFPEEIQAIHPLIGTPKGTGKFVFFRALRKFYT